MGDIQHMYLFYWEKHVFQQLVAFVVEDINQHLKFCEFIWVVSKNGIQVLQNTF
jgi:hypothetical protein